MEKEKLKWRNTGTPVPGHATRARVSGEQESQSVPRGDGSGEEQGRSARRRRSSSYKVPGRNPIRRSIKRLTRRYDRHKRRRQQCVTKTKIIFRREQHGRRHFQRVKGYLVSAAFHHAAAVLRAYAALLATLSAGLREPSRRFQSAVLRRWQPSYQEQQAK